MLDPPSSEEVAAIINARRDVSSLPRLTLGEYRALITQLPWPTDSQIRKFVDYVADAKSWYKHLPLLPPGVPFHFFLDPWAGLDRILMEDSQVVYAHRTDDTPRFHYTWMTTRKYRLRFGPLSFACEAGTDLYLPIAGELHDGRAISGIYANNPTRTSVHSTEDSEHQLPHEVLDAGTIELTGVIHRLAANPDLWLHRLNDDTLHSWPEETGGAETARKILARCQFAEDPNRDVESAEDQSSLDGTDKELAELLAPERQRLQELMVSAMHRVVALLYQAN